MPAVDLSKYDLHDPPEDSEKLSEWNRDVLIQILANTDELKNTQTDQNGRIGGLEYKQANCPINMFTSWWKVSLTILGSLGTVFTLSYIAVRLYTSFPSH